MTVVKMVISSGGVVSDNEGAWKKKSVLDSILDLALFMFYKVITD